jgi:hypothetical protein
MTTPTKHSPLGASGAERWMACPGSNVLLKQLNLPESDEADYQVEGSGAHEAAAHCIVNKLDAWEIIGEKFYDGKLEVTAEIADHIQQYLDFVRPMRDDDLGMWWCEFHISGDSVHPLFYGTVDFAALKDGVLDIVDFKFGQGIVVEPHKNPQLMYYAYGLLQYHPDARVVRLSIVQPRAYHEEGVIRTWETSAEELAEWGEKTLIPAMQAAEVDETLDAGPWCRFCPAKLACPLLAGLFKAAAMINPKIIPNLGDEALARDYKLREAVKFYLKAQDEEVFRRLQTGRTISSAKLVNKRADRVFKDGAVPVLEAALGPACFTAPEFKTPAQIEKLGVEAKGLVKEWAYMPTTGLTVAPIDDKRQAIIVQTTEQAFGGAIAKIEAEG